MRPLTEAQAKQYSPAALAFFGDSIYEVMVRHHLLMQANCPASSLHDRKIQLVCAAFQAKGYDLLLPHLTEEETAILKRGRNASVTVPRHTSAQVYHKATGIECLFGYLGLCGAQERLDELFCRMMTQAETVENHG